MSVQAVEVTPNKPLNETTCIETISIEGLSNELQALYEDDSLDEFISKSLLVISGQSEFDTYNAISKLNYGNLFVLSYETKSDAQNAYKKLKKNKDIHSVEVNHLIQNESTKTSSVNEKKSSKTELKNELFDYIETQPYDSNQVKVAILDSGIYKKGNAYKDILIDTKLNFSDSGEQDSIEDDNGHGTNVASIICENLYSNVKLMPIKVTNQDGKGSILSLYLGIKAAIENNADIINISLTGYNTSQSTIIADILQQAINKGIVVVASAGNDSSNTKNYIPANIDGVITVSSVGLDGKFSSFSNYGDDVDYAAIGEDVICYGLDDEVIKASGTSFATANVTQIIAMLKGVDNTYTSNEVKDILNKYAYDVGDKGRDKYYGNGILSLTALEIKDGELDSFVPDAIPELNINDVEDWKSLSDERLNDYFFYGSDRNNAYFIQSLSEEDFEYVKEHVPYLSNTYNYDGDEIPYYRYYRNHPIDGIESAGSFLSNTGYIYFKISGNGKTTLVKLSCKLSQSSDNKKQSNVTWSYSSSGSYGNETMSNNHKFALTATNNSNYDPATGKTQFTSTDGVASGYYNCVVASVNYTIPAGYHATGESDYAGLKDAGRLNFRKYKLDNTGEKTLNTAQVTENTIDYLSLSINTHYAGLNAKDGKAYHGGFKILLTKNTYKQKVQVRYQNADGSWGAYSDVINKDYTHGSTVSWSRAEDATYKASPTVSYTVTGPKTTQISIERKTYNQKVQVRYQNADGSWGAYSDAINKNYYYGSTVSWSRAADATYKASPTVSYTVTEAKTTQVSVERKTYNQKVQVRYQNADGSWGAYSDVINKNYYYGSTVSWSRAADATYKAASITSYTVTEAKTTQVSVERKTYNQKVQVRYQNVDGSWGPFSDVINKDYYYGSTVSWSRAADATYKAASTSYTVTGARTTETNVYRNTHNQKVQVRYQNADGSWGPYSDVINKDYYYGSTVSWSRAADATYKAASTSYTVTGDRTTQVSVERNRYTVTLNKGTGIASVSGAGTYYAGQSITISATPSTGYRFSNWTGSSTIDTNSTAITVNGNVTYTANAVINTSMLIVNPNGGSWNGSTSTQSFTQNYATTKNIPVPTRTGYTFASWTRTNTNGTLSSLTGDAIYTFGPTFNAIDTLTANWNINSYPVTYIDVVDSTSGTQLGRTSKNVAYGSVVNGSELGSNTSDNAYYNGYYYVSSTQATVTTSGATVYRIFKLRTIEQMVTIKWEDKNNTYGSRPSNLPVTYVRSDGVKYNVTVTGNNQVNTTINEWTYTATLPKYLSNGTIATYTVAQGKVTSLVQGAAYKTPVINGFTITNRVTTNPSEGDVKPYLVIGGTITWNDNSNKYGFRPQNVTVSLLQNGKVIKTVTASSDYQFNNLYEYDTNGNKYVYTISQNSIDRYTTSIKSSGLNTYNIVNDFKTPSYNVTIPKTIVVDAKTGIGEYAIKVKTTNFANNDSITINPTTSFTLKELVSNRTISGTVTQKTNYKVSDNINAGHQSQGTVKVNNLKAGSWKGSINFNISSKISN